MSDLTGGRVDDGSDAIFAGTSTAASAAVSTATSTTASTTPPAEFHGRRYHAYNDWVKTRHGGRLQKISVDAGFTCPNRDGALGVGGCSFCNNAGFTPSYLREQRDIHRQIDTGIAFMRRRYPDAAGFLAYFQSYSNTYGELERLRQTYDKALAHPDIRGLVIGTRPDCLPDATLDYLADLARAQLRTEDLVGRIGGEEFVCILPGMGENEGRGLAERLCAAVATGSAAGGLPRTTISVGLAAVLGASASGWIFDRTGGYSLAIQVSAALSLLAVAALGLAARAHRFASSPSGSSK